MPEVDDKVESSVGAVLDRAQAIPVEIREPDFTLRERTTVGALHMAPTKLEKGPYIASLRLPTGRTISQEVSIDEHGHVDVASLFREPLVGVLAENTRLSRSASFVAEFADSEGGPSSGRSDRQQLLDTLQPMGARQEPATATIKMRCFDGTADGRLTLRSSPEGIIDIVVAGHSIRATSKDPHRTATLQFLQSNHVPVNVVLPAGATISAQIPAAGHTGIEHGSGSDQGARLQFSLSVGVERVDQLIQLRGENRLDDLLTVVLNTKWDDLLQTYSYEHQAAAVAVAYGLLRVARPESFDDAFAYLAQALPSVPDAGIIGAEYASRLGQHKKAVDLFVRASRLGLPMFSYGLSYLVDRLRFYVSGRAQLTKSIGVEPDAMKEAAKALTNYQRFALYCDFSVPMTLYTGLDPSKPDHTVLTAQGFEKLGGHEVKV